MAVSAEFRTNHHPGQSCMIDEIYRLDSENQALKNGLIRSMEVIVAHLHSYTLGDGASLDGLLDNLHKLCDETITFTDSDMPYEWNPLPVSVESTEMKDDERD